MTSIPDSRSGKEALHLAQRRQNRRRSLKPHHSFNRLIRAGAKHLVESGQTNIFPHCHQDHKTLDKASLRPHVQKDLRKYYFNWDKRDQLPDHDSPKPRKAENQDDGRDLAYSDIELPSDRYRLVARPSLEREDAFRYASTSKVHIRRRAEDQQVADLYRMGLLYDDEQPGGGGDVFNLNSIKHDEPLYSIRPAKRARKHGVARGGFTNRALQLDLSFSDLGDDDVLAQYLVALTRAEAGAAVRHASPCELPGSQPPLRVIYELENSRPSFDLDTSQPPDLVVDLLSDYDCFSDGELDDTPSQREVQESADSPPADAWVILGDDS